MAQVINTNVAALFAGAALNKSAIALQTAQQRLSSGLRINSAKDDATGLVAAANLQSQIGTANRNIIAQNNIISTAQTNDGLLGVVMDNLQRIADAGPGTEATALGTENDAIIATTGIAGISGANCTLANVGAARATLGATMATAASEVQVNQISSVNLSAAYSRIMDTDYAAETTAMTRNNILQQAGTAVLAQANQTPNTVLTLLR